MSEDMHVLVLIAEAIHKANFTDPSPTLGVKDAHHKSKEGGSVDLALAAIKSQKRKNKPSFNDHMQNRRPTLANGRERR